MKQIICLFCFLLLAFTSNAEKKPWSYNLEKLVKEASKGDMDAQYWLGRTYEEGRLSVPINMALAFHWYFEAARQGHARSQYHIASMYNSGSGIDKNDSDYIYWLKKCASNSNVENDIPFYEDDPYEVFTARIALAKIMGTGEFGLDKDIDGAIAMANNAILPDNDWAISFDMRDWAKRYCIKKASKYETLGELYFNKGLKSLSCDDFEQSAKFYEKAWEYYFGSSKEKYSEALGKCATSWFYRETFSDHPDYKNMLHAADNGALNDDVTSIYIMGAGYYSGSWGLKKNPQKGLEMLSKIVKVHHEATYIVGTHYYENKDYLRAHDLLIWLSNVENLNKDILIDVLRKLSVIYRFGRGVPHDEEKADYYISKAAELGDTDANKIKEWLNLKSRH